MADLNKYVTCDEAAEILGKTRVAVHYMIQRGEIEAQKVAGRWFIMEGQVKRKLRNPSRLGRPPKKSKGK